MSAIGSHHSARAGTTTWLTPPHILEAVGGWASFDLDPCAAPHPRPWATAQTMYSETDLDGLGIEWWGRVWLNPPYSSAEINRWLAKLAAHDQGTALIFARTETEAFHRQVWEQASGLYFLEGRLHFHHADGSRASFNGGAPSVLCAYGQDDLERLAETSLPGHFVPLRFARMVAVAALEPSWGQVMQEWLLRQDGVVSVADAYRFFARHPKARGRQHWQAQVRKVIARVARRVGPDQYEAAA